jgi:hypothetical protein
MASAGGQARHPKLPVTAPTTANDAEMPNPVEQSTLSRFVRADGMHGGGWLRWLFLSHATAVGAANAAVNSRTFGDVALWSCVSVVGVVASVGFWMVARRTWRRVQRPDRHSGAVQDRSR